MFKMLYFVNLDQLLSIKENSFDFFFNNQYSMILKEKMVAFNLGRIKR